MKMRSTTRWGRSATVIVQGLLGVVALGMGLLIGGARAWAQDFEKVADKPVETIAANPFIAGAYGFIWVAVLFYVVYVARGLGQVKRDIQDLRRKLDA